MAKQPERNEDRYFDTFPTMLRGLLEKHPKEGHQTTYKALGEAVGVRQQTISQYASGQTQPTADVILKIAQFFDVSVDYLLTGVSSYNKEYNKDLGLSEKSVECLRKARSMYPQIDMDTVRTIPYLDELLSDDEFYEFVDGLYYYVEGLKGDARWQDALAKKYDFDFDNYFKWQLQMYVQEFIQKEIAKLGLDIEA